MTQAELNQEVARATGESLGTISSLGFVPLTHKPFERDREPLVVDWEGVDSSRQMLFPA